MKKLLPLFVLLFTAISFFSCEKVAITPKSTEETTTAAPKDAGNDTNADPGLIIGPGGGGETSCPATTVTLVAGQTINAGTVTVSNDAQYIYVTYSTTDGWVMKQTHLYVGDCAAIPVNNPGNPIPGQFPYGGNHNNITSYTYQVPISAIPAGSCACVAAHCVVVKLNASGQVVEQQTGWGNGTQINMGSGNWGMKFSYCSCSL
ncbi:hypothetical protein [Ferruginibacter sp.]